MSYPVRGIRASASHSYLSLEKQAKHVREVLRFSATESLPGLPFFERLEDLKVVGPEDVVALTYAVGELGPGVEALARHRPEDREIEIVLSRESYEALENDQNRPRFSLFHELGHAVLHTTELVQLAEMPHVSAEALARAKTDPHPHHIDTEWQANAFAAALLAPAQGLRTLELSYGALSPDLVAANFGVSPQCAEIRIKRYEERRNQLLAV